MTGGSADEMDGAVGFSCIMGICSEDGRQVAGAGQAAELETVGEAREPPRTPIAVKPYIVV